MSSSSRDNDEPSSSMALGDEGPGDSNSGAPETRPPAKRRFSSTVIEISDTESDDSDVCAVNSYQASADEVKRIRGADYSSSSSTSEYSSDSEESWEDNSFVVDDYGTDMRAIQAQVYPRANRLDEPQLNPKIKTEQLIDRLSLHWKEQNDFSNEVITLTSEPFRLCLLHDFLTNPEMINNIVDDMNTLDWSRKKMDLYEFHQTADLASLTWQRSIRGIYELLETEVMNWVSQVTGLTLNSVSASCSLYGPGDHLLVHDDMLSDRRVAFIFYLAPWRPPPTKHENNIENGAGGDHSEGEQGKQGEQAWGGWERHMGGALQQLACDEGGHPTHVVREVYPRNNMFAFFKVGHDSFHQVEEVLSLELPRLSINGWFHGPAPENELERDPPAVPDPPQPLKPHNEIVVLSQWLEPTYMSPRSRMQIQTQMERESEVCLRDLLPQDKLAEVMAALADPEVPWERVGPPNQRWYERVPARWAEEQDAQHPLRALLRLFGSAAMLRALAECSDLALATHQGLELQRWVPGAYSLLAPREQRDAARLEAHLHLCGAGGAVLGRAGGSLAYVAPDEPGAASALLQLPPAHNALSLVYCDPGAAPFTKYVSRLPRPPAPPFYVLACQYRE